MRFSSAFICLTATRRFTAVLRQSLLAFSVCALPVIAHAQVLSFAGSQSTLAVTGLVHPSAIAIDPSGDRYIVDLSASGVTEVSPSGVQTAIASTLSGPASIALDSALNLYVADYSNNRVLKIPAGGVGIQTTVGTSLSHPSSVVVDALDNIYIADSGNARVLKIAAVTSLQTEVAAGQFLIPFGLAVDASSNLYISDIGNAKLFEVAAGGASAPTTVLSGLSNHPVDVALDSLGDIFLSGGSDHLVTMYGLNGSIRQLGTGLSGPLGLATDAAENVYTADGGSGAIDIISPGSVNLGQANLCPASGAPIAPCTQTVTLNFNLASGQSLAAISAGVSTQGAAGLDFTATSNSCTGSLTGPATCSIAAVFTPVAPGLRLGAVDIYGIVGSAPAATLLSSVPLQGLGSAPLLGFDAGVINTLPLSLQAQSYLSSVITDSAGNLYFVDNTSCVVERYTVLSGVTSVVAGSGTCGTGSGSGGPATSAVFKDPWRLALNGRGDLYISDDQSNVIWKVDAQTQIITAAAGVPTVAGHSPDGVVAAGATLTAPYALAVDGAGDLYFSDYGDETVRRIDATTGVLTTVAGNYNMGSGYSGDGGPAILATLSNPDGLALDSSGSIYIADLGNDVIRKVDASTGYISTIAGVAATPGYTGDGGAATSAGLTHPAGLAVDPAGNVYIADTGNYVVRKVNAATGFITTVSGLYNGGAASGFTLYTGDGGAANLAGLSDVSDVTLDGSGNLYLADPTNMAVREITSASGIVTFGNVNIGAASPAVDVAVTNNGNSPLDVSALLVPAGFSIAGADTSCTASIALSAAATCVLGVQFLPTGTGPFTGALSLTDNANDNAASVQTLALSGLGTLVSTQLVLAGVPATLVTGGNLGTVQASVESSSGAVVTTSTASVTATLTGPDNFSQAITASAVSGVASLDLSGVPLNIAGTYTVTASSAGLTSSSVTVTAIPPATLLAVTGIPATILAGGNLGVETASIEAANHAVITSSTASVTVTITGPGGYSQAVTAAAVSGVATLDLSALALPTEGSYTVVTSSPFLRSVTVTVTVTSSGLDFSVAIGGAAGSSTQTVTAGAAATYAFTVTPTNGTYPQAVTLTATGLPAGATASFSPASVTPSTGPATTTLIVQTAAGTAALRHAPLSASGLGGLAMGLLLLPVAASRRLRKAAARLPIMLWVVCVLSLGAVCGLTGCGGGSSSTTPAPHSYTVTVTGTSGSLSHATTVTLIVQ